MRQLVSTIDGRGHLLERRHNERFIDHMDNFMPQWRLYKEELNRLPVGHVEWGY